MSTNGSTSPGSEVPGDTHDRYTRFHQYNQYIFWYIPRMTICRTNSFKDNDTYVRTRSGTYIRRDSDSYKRRDTGGMPDFRWVKLNPASPYTNVRTLSFAYFSSILQCADCLCCIKKVITCHSLSFPKRWTSDLNHNKMRENQKMNFAPFLG